MAPPILYAFPKSKDLNTALEVESLKAQTLLLFSGVQHEYQDHLEPHFNKSGLPCLLVDEQLLCGRDIFKFCQNALDINAQLSPAQLAVCTAYTALVESKIGLALDYEMWYESINFNPITNQWKSNYPWPLNILVPRNERQLKIDLIMSRSPVLQIQDIYLAASSALDNLAILLGDNNFMFGARPTYLDAALFSIIHIVMAVFPIDSRLRKMIIAHENLVEYSKRIWTNWYSLSLGVPPRA